MKNLKTIKAVELSNAECITIKAKGGWLTIIGHIIGFIADGWDDFKQGYVDGAEAVNEK